MRKPENPDYVVIDYPAEWSDNHVAAVERDKIVPLLKAGFMDGDTESGQLENAYDTIRLLSDAVAVMAAAMYEHGLLDMSEMIRIANYPASVRKANDDDPHPVANNERAACSIPNQHRDC